MAESNGLITSPPAFLMSLASPFFNPQGCWQKLCQAGIHTGKDGKLLVWVFARKILLVTFVGYEFLVILDNFLYNHSSANEM